jgi:pre-mRNA-splicing factor RBM22/SLT11
VCLLDLDYGLPVQVRDQALGMANEGLPESDPGKEYALNRMQVRALAPAQSWRPCQPLRQRCCPAAAGPSCAVVPPQPYRTLSR